MMRWYRLLFFLFIFGVNVSAFSDEGKDGIVLYSKAQWRKTEILAKTSIRGDKIRMDLDKVNDQPITYLLDVASGLAFQLLQIEKIAKGPFLPNFNSAQGDLNKKVPPLIRTGTIEAIAGHKAEQYVRTYEDGRTFEVWFTSDINLPPNVLRGMTNFTSQFSREDMHALAEQELLPMRKVGRLPDGSIWMMNEVLNVERTELGEEIFEIPADFERIKVQTSKQP